MDSSGPNQIPNIHLIQHPNQDEVFTDRQYQVFKAQMCEKANRFEEMAEIMKNLCRDYSDLSVEERNLLSCAYKNIIGSRRASWRILNDSLNEQNKEDQKPCDKQKADLIKSVLVMIAAELKTNCNEIIRLIDDRLIPSSAGESRVFYYKMKGDYTRYLCEVCEGFDRKDKANESLLAYKTASDKAMIELPPTHPVRLGLMLNFSVFYFEIMRSPERSCRLAKQAFDDAIAELDTLSEESYRDSTAIMQLLRDNLNLWESEQQQQLNNNNTSSNPTVGQPSIK